MNDNIENGNVGSEKIYILHLYHDLMNLYGDWANMAALMHEVNMRGFSAEVHKKSIGDDIDFDSYGFIYIGSGTERSQLACMKDLDRHKDVLIERIDAGVCVLATGNSHELFGQAVIDSAGSRHDMIGLLDFRTMQLNTRVTGDCVCTASFLDEKLAGFINRAGGNQKGELNRPFYVEPGEGAGFKAGEEGIKYKNLLGTYLTGPVLMRNPPLLNYFVDILVSTAGVAGTAGSAGSRGADKFDEFQKKAYDNALKNL